MLIGAPLGFFGGNGSLIKSIQQVSITIATGATSNTATISSVVTGRAVVINNGFSSSDTSQNWNIDSPAYTLTNGTTVTVNRSASSASFTVTANATVIEFNSGVIQSMQPFQLTFGASGTATATLSAVVMANTVLQHQGSISTDSADYAPTLQSILTLTNTTTVTGTNNSSSNGIVVNGTAIEFASGILNSAVQQVSIVISAAATSNTATITSVNTANTMLFYGGVTATSTIGPNQISYGQLTNGTTITATRAGTTGTSTFNCNVCEFKSANIKSINRAAIAITSSTTATTTFTAVNTALTAVNFLGSTYTSSAVGTANYLPRLDLTNSTTGTATKNTSTASTLTVGSEFIEFK